MNLLLKANPDVPVAVTLVRATSHLAWRQVFELQVCFGFTHATLSSELILLRWGARGYCLELTRGLREALSTALLASTALINKFKNYVTEKTSASDDPGLEKS